MYHVNVTSPLGTRRWHADDFDHAVEQHRDAFPDEPILAAEVEDKCHNENNPEVC